MSILSITLRSSKVERVGHTVRLMNRQENTRVCFVMCCIRVPSLCCQFPIPRHAPYVFSSSLPSFVVHETFVMVFSSVRKWILGHALTPEADASVCSEHVAPARPADCLHQVQSSIQEVRHRMEKSDINILIQSYRPCPRFCSWFTSLVKAARSC